MGQCRSSTCTGHCLYGCYVHSSIIPTFHRRCYWLLQMTAGCEQREIDRTQYSQLADGCVYEHVHGKPFAGVVPDHTPGCVQLCHVSPLYRSASHSCLRIDPSCHISSEWYYCCFSQTFALTTPHLLLFFFLFLFQNPDIVLVHYLNVPAIEDCGKPCGPILCSINTDKKEWAKWSKEELIGQLKPMFHGIKWTCSNGNSSSGFSVEQLVQQILDSHQTKPPPRTHNCLCTGTLGKGQTGGRGCGIEAVKKKQAETEGAGCRYSEAN
ncbi:hypothetical protein cypCar_00027436 [Cyprinus carpio]|nr:hypothetical protein cypCar_00027436 [Cyprinus carpio]